MKRELIRIRWQHIGILIVLLLAWLPRMLDLGARPLDNSEAVQALNAAQLTPDPAPYWPGEQETISSSPLYEWLTAAVFQIVGSGEAEARFVPALAGLLLAVVPLTFRGRLSRLTLLLGSLFIALSPVAINLSRTSSGMMLGALFLAASVVAAAQPARQENPDRKWILTAVLLGAALASGAGVINGLLSLGLAYLLARWLVPQAARSEAVRDGWREFMRYFWLTPLTAVLLATAMGMYRFGLAGLGESIVIWLQGWIPFGQLSALGFLVAGISYEPFILFTGIAGAVLVWRRSSSTGKLLTLWALGAFLAGLVYPGRSAQDWIWIVLPLSFVSAEGITILLTRLVERERWLQVVALVSISLVLLGAALITLIGYVNGYLQQMLIGDNYLIGLALFAMLLLLSSVFVLFGLGWSWDIVWDGAGITLVLVTVALSLSAAWNLANDPGLGFRTLWASNSPTENGVYLQSTLENASLALTGSATAAPVFFQGDPDPALVWRVRAYPRYEPSDGPDSAAPPILIAPQGAGLSIYGAEYFGQDFALNLERGWFGMLPPDLLRWSLTHSAPTGSTGWVVFIRADIIALGEFSTGSAVE